jgi:membrane AbrB-like protein
VIASASPRIQWLLLVALSGAIGLALELAGLPAALLLGPMAAAVTLAGLDASIRVPLTPYFAAQAAVGCLIASAITPAILLEMAARWPLFLGTIVSVVAIATILGAILTLARTMPGTTAVWGSSPGAATAITLMAEAFGADVRLVAFMQYLRVACVAIAASAVARSVGASPTGALVAELLAPPAGAASFLATLAIVAAGALVAPRLKIPAGPLLLPLALGIVLQDLGLLVIDLPPALLALSYALVGWSIGLRFTRPILAHAACAFPRVIGSILLLIALCGGLAALLVAFARLDPLTAYLATSPGGADTVAIIAASTPVDVPFVMAMQTGRFLLVLALGPSLARLVARLLQRRLDRAG